MPKIAKELGPLAIKNLKHSGKSDNPERHNVGGVSGLMIQVTPNHAKSWLLRTTIAGKRKFLGFGPYPEVSLKEAREKASAEKQKIRSGVDPVSERKAAKAALVAESLRGTTFSKAMEEYLDTKLHGKSEKTQKSWRSILNLYAVPVIGDLLLDDVETHHILRILEPIWREKTETGTRVRGRIEAVLTYSIVKGYRKSTENPAAWKGNLKEILPMPSEVSKITHMPAVQLKDIGAWFSALQKRDGIATRALEFLTLNACRSGEVRGAVWSEIDLEAKIWTIPADRMKMKREHRISAMIYDHLNHVEKLQKSSEDIAGEKGMEHIDMIRYLENKKRQIIIIAIEKLNVSEETVENMVRDLKEKIQNYPYV